ncbi:hypothetical protein IW262DRAFT_1298635 [Armillaria fumosa]|nr:hypothetical protein IW262DRAFT_1298635 [Armillaria fumosa]
MNVLFRLPPLILLCSSVEGVEKPHQFYKTVFHWQDIPIANKSNHLRMFSAIYHVIGCKQELGQTQPSLSQQELRQALGTYDLPSKHIEAQHVHVSSPQVVNSSVLVPLCIETTTASRIRYPRIRSTYEE